MWLPRGRAPAGAPTLRRRGARPHRRARYLTSTSARRDRDREGRLESVIGLDEGSGAPSERVDLGGHRFDRDELTARRDEQLRVRVRRIEQQRERAAIAARAGRDREGAIAPERVVVVEGAFAD